MEKELISQIVVYEVSEDKLILCKDLSGKSLKYAMFDSKKVRKQIASRHGMCVVVYSIGAVIFCVYLVLYLLLIIMVGPR